MASRARLTEHCSMDLCQSGSTYLHKRAHKRAKFQQLELSIKEEITLKTLGVVGGEAKTAVFEWPTTEDGRRRATCGETAVSPLSHLMRQKPSLGGTSQTYRRQ